jgi:hypothetical protein
MGEVCGESSNFCAVSFALFDIFLVGWLQRARGCCGSNHWGR